VPGPRILILTADIGAGHDLPAELLAAAIAERAPGAQVTIADGLAAMGRLAIALGRSGAETILQHGHPLFEAQYWLVSRFGPTRRLAGRLLTAVGGRGLLALIERTRPDAIVSTYPGTTEVLGRLRASGRLRVPCAAAITDLAALRFWAHPGIDLHLVTHGESIPEVRAIAGPRADVRRVRGFTRPQYEAPPSRAEARAALGLPESGPVVAVSGGGWGIGDLEPAARTALALPGATVVCLCGSNTRLRARLDALAADGRLRTEGFTTRMCDWLAAADVLVHSTAGLTVLEAELCGTWAISYGWGIGHVRINNAAYRRFGLADVATTPAELAAALRRALRAPRRRDGAYASLPAAAAAVLELT
jgi:UDP-N-acetylglucosamine:LPS N-acetylglucosamine transferase